MSRPAFNILNLGLVARLVLAGAACAVVWAATLWALA
jgi:hypothetical protein